MMVSPMSSSLAALLLSAAVNASPIGAQSLSLQEPRFADDARLLTGTDLSSPDVLRALARVPGLKPDTVVVGSVNGVTFLYRSNGFGLLATSSDMDWQKMSRQNSWGVECTKDAIEDYVSCRLTRDDLLVVLFDDRRLRVIVGKDHYPDSEVAVRIDEGLPFRGEIGFRGDTATAIVEGLENGTMVVTRYQEWPYRTNVDRRLTLFGFREALQFLRWEVDRFQ